MKSAQLRPREGCLHTHARAAYGLLLYPGEAKVRNKSIGRVCPECGSYWPREELLPILAPKETR